MNYKVVYFTRSGTSKRVAEKIADKLSCENIQITDNMNWKGVIGFIKGGYYASTKKDVEIEITKKIEGDNELVVVSPLWANSLVPAVNAFLKTVQIDKVHLVVTSNASTIKNPIGYKSVTDIVKKNKNEDEIISKIANGLGMTK